MPDATLLNRLPAADLIEGRDFVYKPIGPNIVIVLKTTDAVRRYARHDTEEPLKVRQNFYRSLKGTRTTFNFVDSPEPLIDEEVAVDLISHGELIETLTTDQKRQDYVWRESPPPRFAASSPM